MSEIQVITTDLYSSSNTLNSAGIELGKVQVQLGQIIDDAGDAYEGQLRQALEDILGPGVQIGGRLQNRAGELGRELYDRAGGFETANVAGQSATLKTSAAYINYIETTPSLGYLSILKNKLKEFGQSIWNIAGLPIAGAMAFFYLGNKPSVPKPFDANTSGQPQNSISSQQQSPERTNISVLVKQNDPSWADDPMGPNGDMKKYGCLVTALTMLARYRDVDITPKDFNNWLKENQGYSKNSSNLNWDQAKAYLNSKLSSQGKFIDIDLKTNGLDAINGELNAGQPVVLHVPNPNNPSDGHYVLAVPPKSVNGTFTVLDPWNPGRSTYSINEVTGAKAFH